MKKIEFKIYLEQIINKIKDKIHLKIDILEFVLDVFIERLTIGKLMAKYKLTFRQVVYLKEKIKKLIKEVIIDDNS